MVRERAELDKAIEAELLRTKGFSKEMLLAERLHETFCTWNHVDGCSWSYENWQGDTHKRYLKGAETLMKGWDKTHPVTDPHFVEKAIALIKAATRP